MRKTFDSVVDTFGLEYTIDPCKCLSEMKRVCKKDGLILLLNRGKSQIPIFNWLNSFSYPKEVAEQGFFNNRDWTQIT